MFATIQDHGLRGKLVAAVFARHPSLLTSFKAWRARRKAEAELERFSDLELADIGIFRCEIHRAVGHGVH